MLDVLAHRWDIGPSILNIDLLFFAIEALGMKRCISIHFNLANIDSGYDEHKYG
jgi:hypothetical protein